jgi:putative transposase
VARKWSNRNLPGALHFLTGNIAHRLPVFEEEACSDAFINVLSKLRAEWPFKLVAYVLMPDHIHLIVNPKDGRIRELAGALKSLAARRIIDEAKGPSFLRAIAERDKPAFLTMTDTRRGKPSFPTCKSEKNSRESVWVSAADCKSRGFVREYARFHLNHHRRKEQYDIQQGIE